MNKSAVRVALALALGLSVSPLHEALADPASPRPDSAPAPASPVRLRYRAEEGCPGRADFVTRVEARTRSRSLRAEDPTAVAGLDVVVREEAGRFVAELSVEDSEGRVAARRIEAPTCAEAVDGIALVTALALDPAATSAAVAHPPPMAPPSAEPTNMQPVARGRSVHLRASAGVFVSSGTAPALAPGAELAASAAFQGERALGFIGWVGTRLTAKRSTSSDQGRATFESWAVYGAACPLLRTTSSLWFSVCGVFEGGQVVATGTETTNPRGSVRPWLAIGPAMALEWQIVPNFLLGLDAEGLFPLTRDWFLLGPERVFRVPALAPRAGFRGILRFW